MLKLSHCLVWETHAICFDGRCKLYWYNFIFISKSESIETSNIEVCSFCTYCRFTESTLFYTQSRLMGWITKQLIRCVYLVFRSLLCASNRNNVVIRMLLISCNLFWYKIWHRYLFKTIFRSHFSIMNLRRNECKRKAVLMNISSFDDIHGK